MEWSPTGDHFPLSAGGGLSVEAKGLIERYVGSADDGILNIKLGSETLDVLQAN